MSRRAQAGLAMLAALVLGGGAFYWMHCRAGRSLPALASDRISSPPEGSAGTTRAPLAAQPNDAYSAAHAATGNPRKAPSPPDTGIPLRSGEVLEYSADVAKLTNVANLRLQIAERRNFLGKNAWHLQAFAHTESPLRMVFELDDQFDSYSDAGTLASLQYEMHLSERGQKIESVQRMTTTGKEPAPPNASETRVTPGTRDPLGMMQYLRNVDWSKTPEVTSPVYDGHQLYEVRAKLTSATQLVTVPAGSFPVTSVALRVFDNGAELQDAHFVLYFAHNQAHTPVLLEAVLPFATARVQLIKGS